MLINFKFKNNRSFYNENDLSLQATSDNELRELNTFFIDKKLLPTGNELLKSAVIFGSNASGKTNIIKALSYMWSTIAFSAAQQSNIIKQNETFAFYEKANEEDSLYEVEIIANNTYYKYGFIINNGKIKQEWLYKRKERLIKIFERRLNELEIKGLNKLSVNLIKVPEYALFLSIGNNYNLTISEDILNVLLWFKNLLIVFENNSNSFDLYNVENCKYKNQALEMLKKADIGIKEIEVIKDKLGEINNLNDVLNMNTQLQINPRRFVGQTKQEKETLYNIDVKTKFNVYNKQNQIVGEKEVMLLKDNYFNSEGTLRLLSYLGWILAALDKGKVIFIDEIDAKLHFLVADYLIRMFNSIDKNSNNAQLICTANNIMLMDEDLRRDQIYFTTKDNIGISSLVSLADYKAVRKNNLFSKRYLSGFYSKLPNLNKKV